MMTFPVAPVDPVDPVTTNDLAMLSRGLALANRAVVETIECECIRVHLPEGGIWYDTRPMLDPREHAPEVIDMAREALDYALQSQLAFRHMHQPHLVCVASWAATQPTPAVTGI